MSKLVNGSGTARTVLSAALLAALFVLTGAGSHTVREVAATPPQQDEGARIYARACASCHMAQGQGVSGTFPPLVDSEWVTGDPGHLVRIILHGVTGPILVGDEEYAGTMPPQGAALKDEEIAALSTYIRSAWGNDASAVSPAEVAAIRAASRARTTPWTAEELIAAAR